MNFSNQLEKKFEKIDSKIKSKSSNLNFNRIQVYKFQECGVMPAVIGMALSFKKPSEDIKDYVLNKFTDAVFFEKKLETARRLAFMDGGHNKFIESIVCWFYIKLPRYLWSEFDTYRVGMTKNSESTVHTLTKYGVTKDDFIIKMTNNEIDELNKKIKNAKTLSEAKTLLPESFLQGRMCCFNYKTLRNIILQRRNHKLPEWKNMLYKIASQLDSCEFLPPINNTFSNLQEDVDSFF